MIKTFTAVAMAMVIPTTIAPTLTEAEIEAQSKHAQAVEYARSYSESCVPFVDEIIQYDWDTETAIDVMWHESHCKPEAINPRDSHKGCTGSFGLFQTACIHGDKNILLEPKNNIAKAHVLYKERGWRPWGVCSDGKVDCGI